MGLVFEAFVSENEGLMCREIQVPTVSQMVGTAWVRASRGVTRQTGEFEPEMEGLDVLSVKEGTTVGTNPARIQAVHREDQLISSCQRAAPTPDIALVGPWYKHGNAEPLDICIGEDDGMEWDTSKDVRTSK